MEQYLIYLRKSRKDRDMEQETGMFDTLQRHRDALMALAKRRHYTISGIFEEVVSGDTIAERPEMQKLLAAVETGQYEGVLVMEVPRLARGNTRDQGTVAETFKYSGTKIITPDKVYDPSDAADEEYFEFGLFMSRREYMAINRRLQRGRMASLSEGKYIAGAPPYGYQKTKLPHQKGYTLEIVPAQADVVREIFRLYTQKNRGSSLIAEELNAQSIPSPGGVKWAACSVRDILKNPTYAGYVRWAYRPEIKQMVNGVVQVTHPVSKEPKLKRGVHPAIISADTWTAAQSAMQSRSYVPVPNRKRVSNPLAGLLYCSVCGRSLVQLPQKGKYHYPRLLCPTPHCPTVSCRRSVAEAAVIEGLSNWLKSYAVEAAAPEDAEADAGLRAARAAITRARANLQTLTRQRDNLYDLLEQGVYTQEVFLQRSKMLAGRIDEAEKSVRKLSQSLADLQGAASMRKNLLPRVRNVIAVYDNLESAEEKNVLLKSVIDHVVYSKSGSGKDDDMQLFIFPRVSTVNGHL